jgi:hypothetical protein
MKIDPMRSLETMHKCGPQYAQAKAERIYIEESLRSIKALQMQSSEAQTSAAKEMDAYASEPYRTAVAGLREAVEREEALKWKLVTAQAAIETWRSMEASNRNMDRAAQ